MNINDLKPASALALRLGVKCVAYGPPGSGKTPISNTAPNPVMLVTEPGMLSMRKRAELLQGTCNVEAKPGQGTTVCVDIPLPKLAVRL